MSHTIEPGQVYKRCSPASGPKIRVVDKPITTWGRYGYGKVDIVTLTEDGREIRRRAIDVSQLHDSATTRDGKPRRTGYVLDRSSQ